MPSAVETIGSPEPTCTVVRKPDVRSRMSMYTTCACTATPRFTVSPNRSWSCTSTGRACWASSSPARTEPLSLMSDAPEEYLRVDRSFSTYPRPSSVLRMRKAAGLETPAIALSSVTPAGPFETSVSKRSSILRRTATS